MSDLSSLRRREAGLEAMGRAAARAWSRRDAADADAERNYRRTFRALHGRPPTSAEVDRYWDDSRPEVQGSEPPLPECPGCFTVGGHRPGCITRGGWGL